MTKDKLEKLNNLSKEIKNKEEELDNIEKCFKNHNNIYSKNSEVKIETYRPGNGYPDEVTIKNLDLAEALLLLEEGKVEKDLNKLKVEFEGN